MQTQIPISIQFDLGQFVAFFSQLPQEYRIQIFEFKNEEQKIHAIEKFKGGLANYSGL